MNKWIVIGLLIFASSASHAIESVYDSPSLLKLFDRLESTHNEFYFYESLDQLDAEHGLKCLSGSLRGFDQVLQRVLPKTKDSLVNQALGDLAQILGKNYSVCESVKTDNEVELVEIVFENEKTQLMFFIAKDL